MKTLAISVVTPTLNAGRFVRACLASVRAQGYAHVEHIVVDGGSTDGTDAIVRSTPDVVLLSRRGANQARAINEGFRSATGEILAWLNADDEYVSGALHLIGERFATEPELDVLYGDCDMVDTSQRRLWREEPGRYDFDRLLRRGNYLAQPAVFVRRRVFERVGYLDESFECGMDYEFWLRLRECRIQYIPRVLARYCWHPSSKTATSQFTCWREVLRAVRRYGGGWTPALAWSFSRMLVTLGRQRLQRMLSAGHRGGQS